MLMCQTNRNSGNLWAATTSCVRIKLDAFDEAAVQRAQAREAPAFTPRRARMREAQDLRTRRET